LRCSHDIIVTDPHRCDDSDDDGNLLDIDVLCVADGEIIVNLRKIDSPISVDLVGLEHDGVGTVLHRLVVEDPAADSESGSFVVYVCESGSMELEPGKVRITGELEYDTAWT
jgi:hypothetical protein